MAAKQPPRFRWSWCVFLSCACDGQIRGCAAPGPRMTGAFPEGPLGLLPEHRSHSHGIPFKPGPCVLGRPCPLTCHLCRGQVPARGAPTPVPWKWVQGSAHCWARPFAANAAREGGPRGVKQPQALLSHGWRWGSSGQAWAPRCREASCPAETRGEQKASPRRQKHPHGRAPHPPHPRAGFQPTCPERPPGSRVAV